MKQIDEFKHAWEQFERTGEIGAYLMYRAVRAEHERTGRK